MADAALLQYPPNHYMHATCRSSRYRTAVITKADAAAVYTAAAGGAYNSYNKLR